jgi:hypothetical protein
LPNLKEIVDKRLERYNSIPDKLVSGVDKAQIQLLKEVEDILATLDITDGKIALTESNMVKVGKITEDLKKAFYGTDYVESVKSFIQEFPAQAKITNSQYKKMGIDVALDDDKALKVLMHGNQTASLDLLSENAVDNILLTPIKQALSQSVTAQASLSETLTTIRTFIGGDETIEGNLARYVKQVAYDSFATSDRSYSQKINDDLNLEWYKYTGGVLDTSRCFCDERNGKYFHKKEIEAWGNGEGDKFGCGYPWAGMRKGTNGQTIFNYLGGYNCRHSLIPVMAEVVPPAIIERAKTHGWIK